MDSTKAEIKTIPYQGRNVPVYELQTIDYGKLLSSEPCEVERLLSCCRDEGFFYLDLLGIEGRRTLDDHQRILELFRRFCGASHEAKNEIGLPSQDHGYEPVGTHAGVVDGTTDGYEILKVSRDEISSDRPHLPSIVNNVADITTLREFIGEANIITKVMLSCISTGLGRVGEDRFETTHRNGHKANATLAMMHYLPTDLQTSKTVGHQKHTDIGSLTLLFSEQRGLQVKPTGMAEFGFVEPREGCAIINVGDSLVFASEQAFHSCVHQVVPFNGTEDRFSIAYFLRPESEARYKDSEGRWITAGQWHDEKYNVFQSSHDMQKTAAPSILLGGMREIEV